jgi:hypothetical protein
VLLAISAYSREGAVHRFVNTTDVLATIEDILGISALSQFDRYGQPLRGIWSARPNLTSYAPLKPAQDLEERNPANGADARASSLLDLAREDRIDDAAYNRLLWRALKGAGVPYPGIRRMSTLELARAK